MSTRLAWGILGTGRIAKTFAKAVTSSKNGQLIAVGSRSQETADAFAAEFAIPKGYPTYEELLADPEVKAVYISMPHHLHKEWTIKAANAGKHVLCEKPIGINAAEAQAMIDAAKKNKVFLMEAFMYRCHPQTQKLVELIKNKAIGEVRLIQAAFAFGSNAAPESRLMNHQMAGGGIMDVGSYATSVSRLIAGAAVGKPFEDPIDVKGSGNIGPTRVDEIAVAILTFRSGVIAQCTTGVKLPHDNILRVYGSEGCIIVPNPWMPTRDSAGASVITVQKYSSKEAEEVRVISDGSLFALEADEVANRISAGESQYISLDDTLGNMKTLDRWRAAIGLVWDMEKPGAQQAKP
jgi:predicted dehydrogenase